MTTVEALTEIEQVGATAGSIWQLLNVHGPLKFAEIVKQVDAPRDLVMQGIGWLAREQKITITMQGRSRVVALVD